MHDGSSIRFEVIGSGPALLLPVNPVPVEGALGEQMKQYGADPALGRNLIEELYDRFQVVAFDYEGHVFAAPKPETLTPENIAADFLAVADAAEMERFAYYGYSWLALAGFQLALRTDRLSALAMGGWPPLDAPYAEMLRVTEASVAVSAAQQQQDGITAAASEADEWSTTNLSVDQARQFLTLYRALQDFDDRAAQSQITCPRLCFAGSADVVEYSPQWGDVTVSISQPIISRRAELEKLGWEVRILEGLNHVQAMQADKVLPILKPWLADVLLTPED
jgi:pimeloyl-ACP methyl ester carboxylesterase